MHMTAFYYSANFKGGTMPAANSAKAFVFPICAQDSNPGEFRRT